jgi:hypothetical protein
LILLLAMVFASIGAGLAVHDVGARTRTAIAGAACAMAALYLFVEGLM